MFLSLLLLPLLSRLLFLVDERCVECLCVCAVRVIFLTTMYVTLSEFTITEQSDCEQSEFHEKPQSLALGNVNL